MSNLMQEIRAYPVPQGSIGIWWFGQNGFMFKSPEGTLVSVDLYLSDSVAAMDPALDLHRRAPLLITPEEVDVDLFTTTHSHQDHADPETIRHLQRKDTMRFIGPAQSCDIYRQEGVEESRITQAWPLCHIEHHDLNLQGTFALPTDDTDLNHMGYLIQFGKGPKVYMTGDTDYHDLLAAAAKHKPDLMITCINGGYNNLSHYEAADLASRIKPRVAIPCHYDMFADNSANPSLFRASLHIKAPDVQYHQMDYGKPLLFS